jgi:hypothetical protein
MKEDGSGSEASPGASAKEHKFTGSVCLVAHYENGRKVGQCQICKNCGHVAWNKTDTECLGRKK